MVEMPESAEGVIALLYAVSAVCVSSIGIPQTVSLYRRRNLKDGLQPFRFLWVLLMGALCVGMSYRALVWIDLALFDQRFMGPIAIRWPVEVVIAWLITAASIFSAALYWRTRRDERP